MRVLYCNCSHRGLIKEDVRTRVLAQFSDKAVDVIAVDDLCDLAAHDDPRLHELAEADDLVIFACHPRAARWLMHRAGASLKPDSHHVVDMRGGDPAAGCDALNGEPSADADRDTTELLPAADAWFPVIDYDRCVNCKQCLSFCLFGVYELGSDGKVAVRNPLNCKNNCPACARICPEVAIVFPKLEDGPLNGGEIKDEEIARTEAKANADRILGGDIYAALASRRKRAKSRLFKTSDQDPNASR